MADPAISVVIPTYQRAHVVGEAIASVLRQTCRNFELIVVDDGSTDETAEVVARFDDARLRFLPLPHGGRTRARNEGARHARGRALVFLDSDDQAEPDWLSELVRALDGPAPVVCCGARYSFLFSSPDPTERLTMPAPMGALHAHRVGLFLAGTFAMRRSLFNALGGYDERLAFAENTELAIRIALHCEQHGLPFATVQKPLIWVRRSRGVGADAAAFRTSLEAAELILQQHGQGGPIKRSAWATYRAIAGVNASRLGMSTRAICHLAAAAASKPGAPVHWARFALSLVPPVARRFWIRRAKELATP